MECVARWLGKRGRFYVDPGALLTGTHIRLPDGSNVDSVSTLQRTDGHFPLLACVRLTHGDQNVAGRQWIAEIGVAQKAEGAPTTCTILLQTSEVSARVTAPIQVTRPWIVVGLMRDCCPDLSVPAQQIKSLTVENAPLFAETLERSEREVPWIIISPTKHGEYLVDSSRLRELLYGLAEIVVIPPGEDTFEIEHGVGRYAVWLGAVNIVFPRRKNDTERPLEYLRLLPADLHTLRDEERQPESEILSLITHRSNLPNFWKHVSFGAVNEAILRRKIAQSLAQSSTPRSEGEYTELLKLADQEIDQKEKRIQSMQSQVLAMNDEIRQIQSRADALQHSLTRKEGADKAASHGVGTALKKFFLDILTENASLAQTLKAISVLFPDRVIVLPSAFESASKSEDFKYPQKAFKLLGYLVGEYWNDLVEGKGDGEARAVFGNSYAANEAKSLSKDGRKRRTFSFAGEQIEMVKHLKIGVADNAAETLRIHFEWLADRNLIVIGYCGPHLDF